MKAARFYKPRNPLIFEEIAEPELRPGGVLIKVLEANVPSLTGSVMAGQMPFPLPVPSTPGPGCLGVVEDVADDVSGFFEKGQTVFCAASDAYETIRGFAAKILIGWFGLTPNSGKEMDRWKNGAFAEKAVYPASCVTPHLGETLNKASAIAPLVISYGGLLRGGLRPGQTFLVNGATEENRRGRRAFGAGDGSLKSVGAGTKQDGP